MKDFGKNVRGAEYEWDRWHYSDGSLFQSYGDLMMANGVMLGLKQTRNLKILI